MEKIDFLLFAPIIDNRGGHPCAGLTVSNLVNEFPRVFVSYGAYKLRLFSVSKIYSNTYRTVALLASIRIISTPFVIALLLP